MGGMNVIQYVYLCFWLFLQCTAFILEDVPLYLESCEDEDFSFWDACGPEGNPCTLKMGSGYFSEGQVVAIQYWQGLINIWQLEKFYAVIDTSGDDETPTLMDAGASTFCMGDFGQNGYPCQPESGNEWNGYCATMPQDCTDWQTPFCSETPFKLPGWMNVQSMQSLVRWDDGPNDGTPCSDYGERPCKIAVPETYQFQLGYAIGTTGYIEFQQSQVNETYCRGGEAGYCSTIDKRIHFQVVQLGGTPEDNQILIEAAAFDYIDPKHCGDEDGNWVGIFGQDCHYDATYMETGAPSLGFAYFYTIKYESTFEPTTTTEEPTTTTEEPTTTTEEPTTTTEEPTTTTEEPTTTTEEPTTTTEEPTTTTEEPTTTTIESSTPKADFSEDGPGELPPGWTGDLPQWPEWTGEDLPGWTGEVPPGWPARTADVPSEATVFTKEPDITAGGEGGGNHGSGHVVVSVLPILFGFVML